MKNIIGQGSFLSHVQEDLNNDHIISSIEAKTIDDIFENAPSIQIQDQDICVSMVEKAIDSHFKMSVGATHPYKGKYVLQEGNEIPDDTSNGSKEEDNDDSELDFETEEDMDALWQVLVTLENQREFQQKC